MTDSIPAADTLPSARPPGSHRPAALYALFFLSGLAGLIYEVMWTRSFSLVFGSTTRASAAVLAVFFGGMAAGNALGGRWSARRDRALRRYAAVELVVALTALLVLAWLGAYHAVYPRLYRWADGTRNVVTWINVSLAAAALIPPCMAMGATLPLMSEALAADAAPSQRRAILAYGLNTAGAALGVVLSGFFLPIWVGIRAAVYVAVGLNLFAALVAYVISRHSRASRKTEEAVLPDRVPQRMDFALIIIAAGSGFGTLALEVLYSRLLVNATDSSVFSFAIMLAGFLVCLAIGSLVVAAVVHRIRNIWGALAAAQAIAAVLIMLSPAVFEFAAMRLRQPHWPAPFDYLAYLAALAAIVLGPAVLLIGTALPVVWRLASDRSAPLGRTIGMLTAANTIAAVAGSVIAGFVIVPRAGVSRGFAIVAGLYALVAALAWFKSSPNLGGLLAGAAGVLAVLYLHDTGMDRVLPISKRRGEHIVRYIEGEAASVAVLENSDGERFLQVNNRYVLGSSGRAAAVVQRAQGELPLGLHSSPKRVAFVGVATGTSVSSILGFDVECVVAIELLPSVLKAVPEFSSANRNVLADPRVRAVVADGRNYLYATGDLFDVIVGDLYVPWHAGTGYLYTLEYFHTVKARLAPGGLFAQWFQSDQVTVEQLRVLAGTFTDVFPDTQLWRLNNAPGTPPLLALIGASDDSTAAAAHHRSRDVAEKMPACALLGWGDQIVEWAAGAPRNSDNIPRIEFMAAADVLRRTPADTTAVLDAVSHLGVTDSPRPGANTP